MIWSNYSAWIKKLLWHPSFRRCHTVYHFQGTVFLWKWASHEPNDRSINDVHTIPLHRTDLSDYRQRKVTSYSNTRLQTGTRQTSTAGCTEKNAETCTNQTQKGLRLTKAEWIGKGSPCKGSTTHRRLTNIISNPMIWSTPRQDISPGSSSKRQSEGQLVK